VADQLVEAVPRQLAQRRVRVDDDAVPVEDDALGGRLHEFRQPFLRFAQGLLGLPMPGDVGDQDEAADRLGGGAQVRQQMDLDPACTAVGIDERALVGDRALLSGDLLHLGFDALSRRFADHLGEGQADDGIPVAPERLRVCGVGEPASEIVGAVVGDQHGHVVGEQPQHAGLRLGCRLRVAHSRDVMEQADVVAPGLDPARGALDRRPAPGAIFDVELQPEVALRGQGCVQRPARRLRKATLPRACRCLRGVEAEKFAQGRVRSAERAVLAQQQNRARYGFPRRNASGIGSGYGCHRAGGASVLGPQRRADHRRAFIGRCGPLHGACLERQPALESITVSTARQRSSHASALACA
jgi:hypothetical protein